VAALRPSKPINVVSNTGIFNSKPPATPDRIEAVLRLRDQSNGYNNDVTRSPWGNREALKEIAISQDHNGCGQLLMCWKGGNTILVDFLPELVPPAFGEDEGSQAEDDLSALRGPAHSRTTQPLFDQSFACSLCDA
jgi:hypothetical protein